MKHLNTHIFRWPAMWIPLLGAAYSRARESTCDRHGRACCSSTENAARALSALSAGPERWAQLNLPAYRDQVRHTSGFWMSFHELINGYPWLSKRTARVLDPQSPLPKRNPLAYLPALVVPYAGRLGAGFGMLAVVYVIGVLAAIAIPTYNDYTIKAKALAAYMESQPAREALARHFESKHQIPASLETIGVSSQLADGSKLELDPTSMTVIAHLKQGELVFTPKLDDQGHVFWTCKGERFKPSQLPQACHE